MHRRHFTFYAMVCLNRIVAYVVVYSGFSVGLDNLKTMNLTQGTLVHARMHVISSAKASDCCCPSSSGQVDHHVPYTLLFLVLSWGWVLLSWLTLDVLSDRRLHSIRQRAGFHACVSIMWSYAVCTKGCWLWLWCGEDLTALRQFGFWPESMHRTSSQG